VKAWLERIAARPAVQRALALGENLRPKDYDLAKDEDAKKVLFGQRARR
jgi:GST-like protein